MGKDGSGEPTTKKFKQSQLCFKSPKSGSNILKSKLAGYDNENSIKSPKIQISKEEVTDAETTTRQVRIPLCTDINNISNEKDSPAIEKNIGIANDIDSQNNDKSSESKPKAKHDYSLMDTMTSSSCEPSVPMEVDVVSTVSNEDELKTAESPVPLIVSSNDQSSTSDDDAVPDSNGAPMSPHTPKSSKTDNSKNDSMSSPKSSISLSTDSEDESDKVTSSSSTPATPKTPVTPKMNRQMTPKMLKRHEESLKKKKLQLQLKEEKLALKEKSRNERKKQKLEEEEKKKHLKEEKKKKRLAELELKNEEKRQKQEDKRIKKEKEDEEKKKKKELKLEEQKKEEQKKEEEERRKERTQAVFASFFKKQPLSSLAGIQGQLSVQLTAATDENPSSPTFMPFPMKSDMRLAVVCRRELEDNSKLKLDDLLLDNEECKKTYLQTLKDGGYSPGCCFATWPAPKEELHDCIIIESQIDETSNENKNSGDETNQQAKKSHRGKLLQFCENRRPAYFGTWTKSSKEISGRKPFAKDKKGVLDYEVDSDSDWEEEEEGEDLENMKDDEAEGQEEEVAEGGENGYLLDNTFVPHGYLSDEEQPEDEELQSVEKQKDRLVALREEFDEEMKQGGAQALKPKLLGCLWVSNSTTQVSSGSLYEVLLGHRAVWDESSGSVEVEGEPASSERSPTTVNTPLTKKSLPPIVMQEIARMVEGSRWPLNKLVREVGEVLTLARPQNPVSRLALTRTIKHLASKTLDSKENSVWTIKPEFRAEYNLQELEVNTPTDITPESRSKGKETLLESFLKGQQPNAKKRISLTPISERKDNDKTMNTTPKSKKNIPEITVAKKKVAFVTLPPRTPNSSKQSITIPRTPGPWTSTDGQITIKPHVDTPRPTVNKFVNKDKQSLTPSTIETVEISDDSNL